MMPRKAIGFVLATMALSAFGAPTMGEDDGKYVIDVPAGEGTLTVNDLELFSRRAEGTALAVAADADAIAGVPVPMGLGNKWKVKASNDGKTLSLYDVSGSLMLFR